MSPEFDLVRLAATFSRPIEKRAVRETIRALAHIPDPLLSGGDTGLKSIWEATCVQVQLQESVYWDGYLETIDNEVRAHLKTLPEHEQAVLWLQSPSGEDWLYDQDDQGQFFESLPFSVEEIVPYIRQEVLNKAADWSNKRIRTFLERSSLD